MRTEAAFLSGTLESQGMAEICTYYVLGQYYVGTEYDVEVEAVDPEG